VTNEHSNDVSVVDVSSGSMTARIPVGKAPRTILIRPAPGEQLVGS
jgi:YVTN family beta-propeller protein